MMIGYGLSFVRTKKISFVLGLRSTIYSDKAANEICVLLISSSQLCGICVLLRLSWYKLCREWKETNEKGAYGDKQQYKLDETEQEQSTCSRLQLQGF
jgi:hypothetical protein